VHDDEDPEYSILKARLVNKMKDEGLNVDDNFGLADITKAAERTISAVSYVLTITGDFDRVLGGFCAVGCNMCLADTKASESRPLQAIMIWCLDFLCYWVQCVPGRHHKGSKVHHLRSENIKLGCRLLAGLNLFMYAWLTRERAEWPCCSAAVVPACCSCMPGCWVQDVCVTWSLALRQQRLGMAGLQHLPLRFLRFIPSHLHHMSSI
jgi:hypothetical protein